MNRRTCAAAGLALLAGMSACGRKGNPLPPLHLEPAPVTTPAVRRVDDRVEVRFTIPTADGTATSDLDRVEIYGLALPASAPAPVPARVLDPKNLRGQVDVRPKSARARPDDPPDTRPLPGDAAVFVDDLAGRPLPPGGDVLHYVVVGVRGRSQRSKPSELMTIPLTGLPAAPQGLAVTYDERTLTLTWRPAGADVAYRVYDDQPSTATAMGPPRSLLAAPSYSEPVVFGARRCLIVRAVHVAGTAMAEGPASPPACVTPVDTFPPAAPVNLLLFASEGRIELSWDAVTAPDVAGYVVLRGSGSGDTLSELTTLISDLHYTDSGLTRGTTYWYAVVAEDARKNRSAPSAKQQATVRVP